MISLFGVFAALFVLIFVVTFFSVIAGFWRVGGMANKVFKLAEQEMDRKLREGPANAASPVVDPAVCSHCGSRVVEKVAQCPNCGAGLA